MDVFFELGKVLCECLCMILRWHLESMCTFSAILSISHSVGEQFRTFTVPSKSVDDLRPVFYSV